MFSIYHRHVCKEVRNTRPLCVKMIKHASLMMVVVQDLYSKSGVATFWKSAIYCTCLLRQNKTQMLNTFRESRRLKKKKKEEYLGFISLWVGLCNELHDSWNNGTILCLLQQQILKNQESYFGCWVGIQCIMSDSYNLHSHIIQFSIGTVTDK